MIASTYAISGVLLAIVGYLFREGQLDAAAADRLLDGDLLFRLGGGECRLSDRQRELSARSPGAWRSRSFMPSAPRSGGVVSPWLFGILVGSGERGAVFARLSARRRVDDRGGADRTRDRRQSRTATVGKRRAAALGGCRLAEGRRHLCHEAGHLVLDLGVRLQADIEIKDDLVEPGGLDFFQGIDDLRRRSRAAPNFRSGPAGPTLRSRSTMPTK